MSIGILNRVSNFSNTVLGSGIKALEKTKPMRYLEEKLTEGATTSLKGELVIPKLNKLKAHLPGILGLWITGFYAQSILRNKDIPKERKTPLFINNIFCGALGAGAGYYVSAAMEKFNKHFLPRFEKVLRKQKLDETKINSLKGAMGHSIIPLLAFSFAFRYLGPIIATPLADKVNKFLIKHKLINDPKPKTSSEKFNSWKSNLSNLKF